MRYARLTLFGGSLLLLALFGGGLLLLTLAPTAHTQDPFGDQNRDQPRLPKVPQLPVKLPDVLPDPEIKFPENDAELTPGARKIRELVDMSASVAPETARRGEIVRVTIQVDTKPWAYTYSAIKKHPTQSGIATTIGFKDAPWLTPLNPITEAGTEEHAGANETAYTVHGRFTWQQDVYVSPTAPVGRQVFWIVPHLQVCTKKNEVPKTSETCYSPSDYRPLKVVLKINDDPALPPPADLAERAKVINLNAAAPPAGRDGSPTKTTRPSSTPRFESLGAMLLAAVGGAILMLLTPCVFPMIPITVNFFIKQSEKEHHRPFLMASMYAATIVVLLTLVVMLVGKSIIDLANDAWFNLALGFILIMFALGLFGMFDVGLTMFFGTVLLFAVGFGLSWLAKISVSVLADGGYEFPLAAVSLILAIPLTWGLAKALRLVETALGFEESMILGFLARQESRGGMLGAAFMAMTFTITSFSCTGPFLGILLAPLAGTNLPKSHLFLGALAYSVTFAAPFFVLALFPTYLKKLPKSGGWMTTIKVTMGFLEIGAALKFLSTADGLWFPGNPRLFNFDTVLCSWIALSFACSLYLFGVFRLHHDTPEDHIGVPRMIFGSIFLGMALYLLPLLFGTVPQGIVMEKLISFLPQEFGRGHGEIPWIEHDYETAWKKAVAENKLIFIDFTGYNCANCRENERNVFPRRKVVEELKKYICVKLYTDSVQDSKLSSTQAKKLADINSMRQDKLINDAAQPSYVILDPNRDRPFDGQYIAASVLGVRTGRIEDVTDFERFLEEPLQERRTANAAGTWFNNFETARAEAIRQKKLMFVEFSGINDANARQNQRNILENQRASKSLSVSNFRSMTLVTSSCLATKGVESLRRINSFSKNCSAI